MTRSNSSYAAPSTPRLGLVAIFVLCALRPDWEARGFVAIFVRTRVDLSWNNAINSLAVIAVTVATSSAGFAIAKFFCTLATAQTSLAALAKHTASSTVRVFVTMSTFVAWAASFGAFTGPTVHAIVTCAVRIGIAFLTNAQPWNALAVIFF